MATNRWRGTSELDTFASEQLNYKQQELGALDHLAEALKSARTLVQSGGGIDELTRSNIEFSRNEARKAEETAYGYKTAGDIVAQSLTYAPSPLSTPNFQAGQAISPTPASEAVAAEARRLSQEFADAAPDQRGDVLARLDRLNEAVKNAALVIPAPGQTQSEALQESLKKAVAP